MIYDNWLTATKQTIKPISMIKKVVKIGQINEIKEEKKKTLGFGGGCIVRKTLWPISSSRKLK